MKYVQILSLIFSLIFSVDECINVIGTRPIRKTESPCQCNNNVCQEGKYCNEVLGGCSTVQVNLFNYPIEVTGKFSFNLLQINDHLDNGLREQDSNFNHTDTIPHAQRNILMNDDGTYWTLQNTRQDTAEQIDAVVQLRRFGDNKVLKAAQFSSLDDHELRIGNHPLEIVCISWIKLENDMVKQSNGIAILDFSRDPPTRTEINLREDFDPQVDWGKLSDNNLEWMHANSAGVDNSGNQYVNFRSLSATAFYQRDTKKHMQTISSEITSDFIFPNNEDKFQNAHDAHQLPNGNWIQQDNGNTRPQEEGGPQSRCIEYEFDLVKKQVRKVWEQKFDMICSWTGSCRRLDNGNTLIAFYSCTPIGDKLWYNIQNQVKEVDMNGNVVGSAVLPWGDRQDVQRAAPTKYKRYQVQKHLLWVIIALSLITIIPVVLWCYQNQFKSSNQDEEQEVYE